MDHVVEQAFADDISRAMLGKEADPTDTARPIFYRKPVEIPAKSKVEGRPIYEERDYVKIFIPGSRKTEIDRKVTEEDMVRWPAHWSRYLQDKEARQDIEGTPLEMWPFLNQARCLELKALNILTVEDLAGLDDGLVAGIGMGGVELRARARQHLKPEGDVVKQLRAENASLQSQINELVSRLDTMTDKHGNRAANKAALAGEEVTTEEPYVDDDDAT